MWNSNNHEKGAMAMLAVMMLLSTATIFIFNITNRLDSVLSSKAFLDKNSEIKKITNEIKDILSNPTSCTNTLNQIGETKTEIKDGSNTIFGGTPSDTGARDNIYKQVKLKDVTSKLESSAPIGSNRRIGRGTLEIKFTTSADLNNVIETKTINLWIETEHSNLIHCSTAPPAHGSLNCEPIKAEIACCLFTYYLDIPGLDLLAQNNSINISDFTTTKIGDKFEITLTPKRSASTYVSESKLGLLINPGDSNILMRKSTFGTEIEREDAIDERILQCNNPEEWAQKYTGTIKLNCERGSWRWEGTCDNH